MTQEKIEHKMKNIPKKIYLQIGDETDTTDDFSNLEGVTWSTEKNDKNDIAYALQSKQHEGKSAKEIFRKYVKFHWEHEYAESGVVNMYDCIKAMEEYANQKPSHPAQQEVVDKKKGNYILLWTRAFKMAEVTEGRGHKNYGFLVHQHF